MSYPRPTVPVRWPIVIPIGLAVWTLIVTAGRVVWRAAAAWGVLP